MFQLLLTAFVNIPDITIFDDKDIGSGSSSFRSTIPLVPLPGCPSTGWIRVQGANQHHNTLHLGVFQGFAFSITLHHQLLFKLVNAIWNELWPHGSLQA